MPHILSVNLGRALPSETAGHPVTGIDKRPVAHPVQVSAPGPKGVAGSGLSGDAVCNHRHHGGNDQAVYAYAREDLDQWSAELGRVLPPGTFGENLTTVGLDISAALIGETWLLGDELTVQVSDPRIPCRNFARWLGERGWVRRFTARAAPGTYLRVLQPGPVRAGDQIRVVDRPDHDITVSLAFRAFTSDPGLLPRLSRATGLSAEAQGVVRRRVPVLPTLPVLPALPAMITASGASDVARDH